MARNVDAWLRSVVESGQADWETAINTLRVWLAAAWMDARRSGKEEGGEEADTEFLQFLASDASELLRLAVLPSSEDLPPGAGEFPRVLALPLTRRVELAMDANDAAANAAASLGEGFAQCIAVWRGEGVDSLPPASLPMLVLAPLMATYGRRASTGPHFKSVAAAVEALAPKAATARKAQHSPGVGVFALTPEAVAAAAKGEPWRGVATPRRVREDAEAFVAWARGGGEAGPEARVQLWEAVAEGAQGSTERLAWLREEWNSAAAQEMAPRGTAFLALLAKLDAEALSEGNVGEGLAAVEEATGAGMDIAGMLAAVAAAGPRPHDPQAVEELANAFDAFDIKVATEDAVATQDFTRTRRKFGTTREPITEKVDMARILKLASLLLGRESAGPVEARLVCKIPIADMRAEMSLEDWLAWALERSLVGEEAVPRLPEGATADDVQSVYARYLMEEGEPPNARAIERFLAAAVGNRGGADAALLAAAEPVSMDGVVRAPKTPPPDEGPRAIVHVAVIVSGGSSDGPLYRRVWSAKKGDVERTGWAVWVRRPKEEEKEAWARAVGKLVAALVVDEGREVDDMEVHVRGVVTEREDLLLSVVMRSVAAELEDVRGLRAERVHAWDMTGVTRWSLGMVPAAHRFCAALDVVKLEEVSAALQTYALKWEEEEVVERGSSPRAEDLLSSAALWAVTGVGRTALADAQETPPPAVMVIERDDDALAAVEDLRSRLGADGKAVGPCVVVLRNAWNKGDVVEALEEVFKRRRAQFVLGMCVVVCAFSHEVTDGEVATWGPKRPGDVDDFTVFGCCLPLLDA